MHTLIFGAAGMLGRKLADRIASSNRLGDIPVETLTLVDVVEAPQPAGFSGAVKSLAADLAQPGVAEQVRRPAAGHDLPPRCNRLG